jgi:uncharacterized protein YdeI (BOF family)
MTVMKSVQAVSIALACSIALIATSGCGNDVEAGQERVMYRTPIGTWYAMDQGIRLNIEASGDIEWNQGNQTYYGTYEFEEGTGEMTVTLDGETFEMPYERNGLEMTATLPNSGGPVTLQME